MIVTLGLGIIAGFFLVLAFKLEDQHFFIKILGLFFSMLTLLSLSSYIMNNQQQCEIVLLSTNVTNVYGDNFTTNSPHWDDHSDVPTPDQISGVYLFDVDTDYFYQQICYNKPGSASTLAAFKLVNLFIRLALVYMFIFIIWWLFAEKGREMLAQVERLMRRR